MGILTSEQAKIISRRNGFRLLEQEHPFQTKGLGVAPFYVEDCNDKPGNCQYCGTAFRWEYKVRSKDNKTFVVGSECIKKTKDWRLIRAAKREREEFEKRQAAANRPVPQAVKDHFFTTGRIPNSYDLWGEVSSLKAAFAELKRRLDKLESASGDNADHA